MASKVSKRSSANIKGLLEIDGDKILVHVEDVAESYNLAGFIKEFDDMEVLVSVSHKEDLGGEET